VISLFKNIKIAASVFNENMAPHLQAAHPNLTIFNPAKIAAIKFVEALDEPVTRRLRYTPVQHEEVKSQQGSDKLIMILGFSFVGLLTLATFYFHYSEKLSLLNSFYFVIVTVATVGYGDISLVNASPVSLWRRYNKVADHAEVHKFFIFHDGCQCSPFAPAKLSGNFFGECLCGSVCAAELTSDIVPQMWGRQVIKMIVAYSKP